MGSKETGGVVIALLGFAALTLAFKGTWENVWHALVTGSGTTTVTTGNPGNTGAATTTGAPAKTPGSGPIPQNSGEVTKNVAAG